MRGWEILKESGNESEFESDLTDLLIAAKANHISEVSVDDLVDQLNGMGHSVTADSLVATLDNPDNQLEFIDVVTLNTITLKSHSVDDAQVNDYEDKQVDAKKLASKTAMKGVKQKQDRTKQAAKEIS
jgi:hypothetical protein|tara:strand:- start:131 stop:514 length:384 start_codon:yes stop_codon:yes gene_type:complete